MRLEGQIEKTEEKNLSLFFSFDFRQEPSFFISDHQKKYFFFPIVFSQSALENVVKVVSGGKNH